MLRRPNHRGYAIFEYVVLVILVLAAIFVFRSYVLRGLSGKHKSLGDAYGFGRQYDPKRTITCGYDDRIDAWYDETCYENERRLCAVGNNECEKEKLEKCHIGTTGDAKRSMCDDN